MRQRVLPLLLLACGSLLAALPAAAEIYTVKLSNGAIFESRHQPKQASFDPTVLTLIDENGVEVALPKALVANVSAQSETKGFGRVINTTTVDLGFMPNDMPTAEQMAAAQQQNLLSPTQQFFNRSFDQKQFVEPDQLGGGVPVYGLGGATSGGLAPGIQFPEGGNTGTPAPFTTPTQTTTPAPFTQPLNTTPAPFTTPTASNAAGTGTPPQ